MYKVTSHASQACRSCKTSYGCGGRACANIELSHVQGQLFSILRPCYMAILSMGKDLELPRTGKGRVDPQDFHTVSRPSQRLRMQMQESIVLESVCDGGQLSWIIACASAERQDGEEHILVAVRRIFLKQDIVDSEDF